MSNKITKALNNILTGKDNETHDVIRVSGLLGVLTFLGIEIFVSYTTVMFDPIKFGSGLGIVLGAVGGALKLKADTEPQ